MNLVSYNTGLRNNSFKYLVDSFFKDEYLTDSLKFFTPKVDIAETENSFEVHLHASGMKKEDFKIDLNLDHIVISGERKFEKKKEEKNFHSLESHYGSFSRSFYLPEAIDREKIDAKYENGILYISIPKDEKVSKQKTIAVK